MNTKTYQPEPTEHPGVEPTAGRVRTTGHRAGLAIMAIVTVATGVALTALVVGVTSGTGTEAPPSPGVTRPYGDQPPPQGLDQRLYNLAEERTLVVPPRGIDQRLYNLADEWAAGQRARQD